LLFISISEQDIPGDAKTDEAGKGNSKKDILINVEELHVDSYLKLCHSLGRCYLIVEWSKAGAHIPKIFQ
jgi:hypothetical protein